MSTSELPVKLKRPRKLRKWSIEEAKIILNYLSGTRNNFKIEKPTAYIYYRNLMSNWPEGYTLPPDITPDLLKNKVRNLRQSYIKTRNWSTLAGAKIKETEGEQCFTKILLKRCPTYFQCDSIWREESSARGNSHAGEANQVAIGNSKVTSKIPDLSQKVVVEDNHELTPKRPGKKPDVARSLFGPVNTKLSKRGNLEDFLADHDVKRMALQQQRLDLQEKQLAVRRKIQLEREKLEYQMEKEREQHEIEMDRLRLKYKELELELEVKKRELESSKLIKA